MAGLILGLIAYPPTAWFALLELAVPSAVVGTFVGLAAGCVAVMVRRLRNRPLVP